MIDNQLLAKAYLEATYWWINWEGYYHTVFRKWKLKTAATLVESDYALFHDFAKQYSVMRTVTGGKAVLDHLLRILVVEPFLSEVTQGTITMVDGYADVLGQEQNKLTSLLSKFATLVNPSDFTMYDGLAKVGLARLLYGQDSSRTHREYSTFHRDWLAARAVLKEQVSTRSIDLHYHYVCSSFDTDSSLLTREIYFNRVTDKYLWWLGRAAPQS